MLYCSVILFSQLKFRQINMEFVVFFKEICLANISYMSQYFFNKEMCSAQFYSFILVFDLSSLLWI